MPFVLTGNLETDTMCRFGMAEIQQGGGAKASRFDQGRWALPGPSDSVESTVWHVFTSR
jgi:hypothetical protein